jgi:hypothetical protein
MLFFKIVKSQSKLDPWHFIHGRTQLNSNKLWSGPLKKKRKKENKLMEAKMKSPTAGYFSENTGKTKK